MRKTWAMCATVTGPILLSRCAMVDSSFLVVVLTVTVTATVVLPPLVGWALGVRR